jgi:hypothetical protein
VPRATGSLDLSVQRLRDAHLRYALRANPTPFGSYSGLSVVGQRPLAGKHVSRDSVVSLRVITRVSSGGVVLAGTHPAKVRVPKLIGRPFGAAVDDLRRRGLGWNVEQLPESGPSSSSNALDAYRVVRQAPDAGTFARWGNEIALAVASG